MSTFLFTCFCVFQHFYSESSRCYNQKNIVLETRSAPWRGPQPSDRLTALRGLCLGAEQRRARPGPGGLGKKAGPGETRAGWVGRGWCSRQVTVGGLGSPGGQPSSVAGEGRTSSGTLAGDLEAGPHGQEPGLPPQTGPRWAPGNTEARRPDTPPPEGQGLGEAALTHPTPSAASLTCFCIK